MLLSRIQRVVIEDIKCIARSPVLLIAILSPLIIILFHLFKSEYISGLKDADITLQYFTVISVSLVSAIPFVYGLVFSFIHLIEGRLANKEQLVQKADKRRDIYLIRVVISGLSAFIVVLSVIYITDPVNTEGWLRSIYVSVLLATITPLIFAFTTASGGSFFRWRVRSLVSILFILPVPFGLILHHPWNYLAFFSPFYWTNWAWIIPSPGESLLYGFISLIITAAGFLILYMKYVRDALTK